MAVVDARLRMYGINKLRVVDCSIMPTITTANTNIPVIMIAEKASDMVKEDHLGGMSSNNEENSVSSQENINYVNEV